MSVSPTSTVWTGQSSKKRVVSNRTPVKSTIGYSRRDKHLTGIPCEKRFLEGLTSDKWNLSYQALRLEKEWTELDQCRNMKRNSEIVQHRIDNMYMMSGSGIRLKPKYDVNESELQQLKDLSRARQVLRDKSKRNQPSTKGRQTNMSGRQSSKSGKTDASHPQIRISGDSQKEGTNTENPSQADWASDPGSHPIQSPCTPPGNHGDTVTDEAGKIINQNEKDSKHVAEDVVRTEEGEENKENIEVNPKSDGKEGQDGGDTDEGQQGEGAPTNENVGDGKETGVEKETVQNGLTEEIVAANGTENVEKDVGEENVDLNEDETVKAKNVTPNDATETQDRSEKENEIDH